MLLVVEASPPVLAPTVLRVCPEHPLFHPTSNPTKAGLRAPVFQRREPQSSKGTCPGSHG